MIFAALLRGINVGGNKTVGMAELKALLEAQGLQSVRTLLNSGNVVFSAGDQDGVKVGKAIEDAIAAALGFRPAVIVRSAGELELIVRKNPFPAMAKDDPGHLVVMCLSGKPGKDALTRLAKAYAGPEQIRVAGENVYLTYPNGIGKSKLTNVLLERHLGVTGTARNWNTVLKLRAAAAGG